MSAPAKRAAPILAPGEEPRCYTVALEVDCTAVGLLLAQDVVAALLQGAAAAAGGVQAVRVTGGYHAREATS